MTKILGIIGAGHLGQQIAYYAISDNHFDKVVFFDDYTDCKFVNGFNVLGKIKDVINCFNENLFTELIIGIGYKHMERRKFFFNQFRDCIRFASIIHSSCYVDSSVKYGVGIVVYPGSVIDARVTLKNNILINVGCTIAHDTTINSHCFLSPRVALAGLIEVGEQSILGINCTIIDNISIAAETQIGGGSVVIKSISEKGLYVGNPVRYIR